MPSIFEMFDDLKPRSVLPAGGSPRDDAAYLEWRRAYVERINARWLDRNTRFGCDLPDSELIDGGALDEHLFHASGGTRLFEAPNYQHRLRHLGIAFRDRRPLMIREANLYAARRMARQPEHAA